MQRYFLLLLFVGLIFSSCSPKKRITIPAPPVAANLTSITTKQISLLLEQEGVIINPQYGNSDYSQVNPDYIKQYFSWYRTFIFNFNLNYWSNKSDCDSFAQLFCSLKSLTVSSMAHTYNQPAIGIIIVKQINTFDSVVGDKTGLSYHALDIFVMNNKVYVIEPQLEFPEYVELKDYPNKDNILFADFN